MKRHSNAIYRLLCCFLVVGGCTIEPPLASIVSQSPDEIWVKYQSSAIPKSRYSAQNLADNVCWKRHLKARMLDQNQTLNDLTYVRFVCVEYRNN